MQIMEFRNAGRRQILPVALVMAVAALLLTLYVAVAKAPVAGDVWLTREVQAAGWFSRPAGVVNLIGSWVALPFALGVIAVLLGGRLPWMRTAPAGGRRAAIVGLFTLIPLSLVDNVLKWLVRSPRPSEAAGVRVDYFRDSFGFPSGHVYNGVLLLGGLALAAPFWLPGRWVWPVRALLLGVIALAGLSRVFVGAHWPSDTAGGYLWGTAVLLGTLALVRWRSRRGEGAAAAGEQ